MDKEQSFYKGKVCFPGKVKAILILVCVLGLRNGCEMGLFYLFHGKYIKHTVFSSVLFQWERGGNVEFLGVNVSSLEPWLIECSKCSL